MLCLSNSWKLSMVPGAHFWHVLMHFFHVFSSSHLPFFFSFMHFLVEILSLQSNLWVDFSFSGMYVSKTCFVGGVLRTRSTGSRYLNNYQLSKKDFILFDFHWLSTTFEFVLEVMSNGQYCNMFSEFRAAFVCLHIVKSDLDSFWQTVWKSV